MARLSDLPDEPLRPIGGMSPDLSTVPQSGWGDLAKGGLSGLRFLSGLPASVACRSLSDLINLTGEEELDGSDESPEAPPVAATTTGGPALVVGAAQPAVPDGAGAGDPVPVVVEILGPTVDDLLALGPFSFLCGAAGTGKTWLARQLASRDDTILCATTGIAAVNLGEAVTINSVLGYYDTHSLMHNYASGTLQTRLRALRRGGITKFVLDEVSMLDADQLTIIVQAMREVSMTAAYDSELSEVTHDLDPKKVMGLVLVGDFAQLPPVKASFAFASNEWAEFGAHTIQLKTVRRQADATFINALQAVRRGDAAAAIPVFAPKFCPTIDFEFDGATIVAKNDEVDRINLLRHSKLGGQPLIWKTIRSGEQQPEWTKNIPNEVSLKPGSLVMILANRAYPKLGEEDLPSYVYVNGDLATVEELMPPQAGQHGGIRVKLKRDGRSEVVKPVVREWKEPTGDKKNPFTIKGTISYMPLRLAYATTVHKSQGLSLDKVQLSIGSWMFGKPGMLYVALSRCRTLEGLRIVGNAAIFKSKCTVDPLIKEWLV